jgi:hypothetical protein
VGSLIFYQIGEILLAKWRERKLPDHSLKVRSGPDPTFPVEVAEKLAIEYGFEPDFDLAEELDWAWFWYDTYMKGIDDETTLEGTRKLLLTFQEYTSELNRCVQHFGPGERKILGEAYRHRFGNEPPWKVLDDELVRLSEGGCRALASVPKSRGGRKMHPDGFLARRLFRIYLRGTGDTTRVQYDREREEYTGRVVDFVCDCMSEIGVQDAYLNDIAMGKRIERFQDEVLATLDFDTDKSQ